MTESVKGKTAAEAEALFNGFHDLIMNERTDAGTQLGKLTVLSGVREYPARVKCATLAWHTLHTALRDEGATATTE